MKPGHPGYINACGTIYKVKGAKPLPVKTPVEQRNEAVRQQAFVALRIGFERRRHRDRREPAQP